MGVTSDPNHPELTRGVDSDPVEQARTYLVLSDAERAKGYVRPVRRTYVHHYWLDGRSDPLPIVLVSLSGIGGCGFETSMGSAIAETYARDPSFYGSTYCIGCRKHLPVAEFSWEDGTRVGS